MPNEPYQVSVFDVGRFENDKWTCGCNLRAQWYTSRTEATSGQSFARCPRRNDSCSFFLWEYDDGPAREALAQRPRTPPPELNRNNTPASAPQTPHSAIQIAAVNLTPTHRANQQMQLPSTPTRASGSKTRAPTRLPPSPLDTPSNLPFSRLALYSGDDAGERGDNLSGTVLDLVRAHGVELSNSAEIEIRHEISLRERVYETQLAQFESTVRELMGKIREMEERVGERRGV